MPEVLFFMCLDFLLLALQMKCMIKYFNEVKPKNKHLKN